MTRFVEVYKYFHIKIVSIYLLFDAIPKCTFTRTEKSAEFCKNQSLCNTRAYGCCGGHEALLGKRHLLGAIVAPQGTQT